MCPCDKYIALNYFTKFINIDFDKYILYIALVYNLFTTGGGPILNIISEKDINIHSLLANRFRGYI